MQKSATEKYSCLWYNERMKKLKTKTNANMGGFSLLITRFIVLMAIVMILLAPFGHINFALAFISVVIGLFISVAIIVARQAKTTVRVYDYDMTMDGLYDYDCNQQQIQFVYCYATPETEQPSDLCLSAEAN